LPEKLLQQLFTLGSQRIQSLHPEELAEAVTSLNYDAIAIASSSEAWATTQRVQLKEVCSAKRFGDQHSAF
jgi:hypothetical protein